MRSPRLLCPYSPASALTLCAMLALSPSAAAQEANTLPQGGRVVAGQASLSQGHAHLTVAQHSERATIEWQSFSIGSDASVQFVQPSAASVTLNRVVGGDLSRIAGRLSANGRIYLVNSAGIVFERTARVDAGQLVTSTLDIADGDFLTGSDRYSPGLSAKENLLVQQSSPRREPHIRPGDPDSAEQTDPAQSQTPLADPSRQLTLDAGANGHLRLGVAASQLQTLIETGGLVEDEDGLALTAQGADSLAAAVVAPAATPSARGVSVDGGRVWLRASASPAPPTEAL